MIDSRLRTLQLVVHHGSVTVAARALHFTPSAVSQQLRSLSDELGVTLVHQVGRGMVATAAGHVLLRHATTLQAQDARARAELAGTEPLAGAIGLCGFSTAAGTLLAPTAAALRARFPDLEVQVVEAEPERCVDLLLAGDCHLALVVVDDRTPPVTDARFEQRAVLDDPLDLAVPAEHRLTTRSRVTLRDVAGEDWIMGRPGSAYHRLAMAACQAAGFRPTVAHYSDEWDTGAALVAHGLGIFLLPRLAPLHRPADVRHDPRDPMEHTGRAGDVVRVPLAGPSAPVRHINALIRAGTGEQPAIAHALHAIAAAAQSATTAINAP